MKVIFALLFILAGLNHFLSPALYITVMPPYLPWHRVLVYVSGALELLGGLLLLAPGTQALAAWGLIALLIAVFPANLHMALHAELYPRLPAALLWLRLPLQGVLIAWAYRYT